MRSAILASIGLAAFVISCANQAPVNVMTLPAVCDSVPPAVPIAARRIPRVPETNLRPSTGAVVGAVIEMVSSQPIAYAMAELRLIDSSRILSSVPTDTLGGFALRNVPPGAYRLRVRAMQHRFEERGVLVQEDVIDTVQVHMRYFTCTGY